MINDNKNEKVLGSTPPLVCNDGVHTSSSSNDSNSELLGLELNVHTRLIESQRLPVDQQRVVSMISDEVAEVSSSFDQLKAQESQNTALLEEVAFLQSVAVKIPPPYEKSHQAAFLDGFDAPLVLLHQSLKSSDDSSSTGGSSNKQEKNNAKEVSDDKKMPTKPKMPTEVVFARNIMLDRKAKELIKKVLRKGREDDGDSCCSNMSYDSITLAGRTKSASSTAVHDGVAKDYQKEDLQVFQLTAEVPTGALEEHGCQIDEWTNRAA